MKHWIFNCREVSRLLSESFDREIPPGQKVGLRIHRLMCRFCARYAKQLRMLRMIVATNAEPDPEGAPFISLPEKTRDRIKASLLAQTGHPV